MGKGTTRIGVQQPELEVYTRIVSEIIRKINESDDKLSPKEQAVLIKKLTGLQNRERIDIVRRVFTRRDGIGLHPSITAIISPGRGDSKIP